METVIQLVEYLDLTIRPPTTQCPDGLHGSHLELATLLLRLPERFNESKVSVKIISNTGSQFEINTFMLNLGVWRKELVFKEFAYEGTKVAQDCINGLP